MAISDGDTVRIAIELPSHLVLPQHSSKKFQFVAVLPEKHSASDLSVKNGSLSGLVVPDASGSGYELHVARTSSWVHGLEQEFAPVYRRILAQRFGLSDAESVTLFDTPSMRMKVAGGVEAPETTALYGLTIAFMVLTILGVITSLSIILQGISGEKFGRISEMILTAIPPKVWIDGKLIAATLHGLKTIVTYSLYSAVVAIILGLVSQSALVQILSNSALLSTVLLLCTLGLLLWNNIFAAVASLLPNAHSPVKNTLALVPMSFLLICLGGIKSPDNHFMVFLSIFPASAPFAMPVRLLSGAVSWIEVVSAFALLLISIVVLRALTIRIFARAVLNVGNAVRATDIVKGLRAGGRHKSV